MILLGLFVFGLLLCLLICGVIFRQFLVSILDGLLVSSCVVFMYLSLSTAYVSLLEPYGAWDAARLAPTVAFSQGFEIYSTKHRGAVLSTMYPPAWVMSYLPISFAESPTEAIVLGRCLTLLYSFTPVAVFCLVGKYDKRLGTIAFGLFVFAAIQSPSLSYSCFKPHADAPSLGVALASCLFLSWAQAAESRKWPLFCASLLCAWLAVWSKQVMLPLLPALAIWKLASDGFRPFVVFLVWAALIGAIVFAGMVAVFSYEGMLFNLLVVPGSCPWKGQFPENMVRVTIELMSMTWLPLLILLAGAVTGYFQEERSGLLGWLTKKGWALVAFVALCHVPMSLLGRVKVGGAANALSPSVYFLLVSLCLLFLDVYYELSESGTRRTSRAYLQFVSLSCLVIITTWTGVVGQRIRDLGLPLSDNKTQIAFEYLRDGHPETYFPTQPLANLLANRKLYHHDSAIHDRDKLSGHPVSQEHLNRHVPEEMDLVCWSPSWGGDFVRAKYFSEYDVKVEVKELPGYECFRKSDSERPSNR